jgi:hypothetical protein
MADVSITDSEKLEFQFVTDSGKQEFQSVTESEKQEFQCGCGVYLSSDDLVDYKSDVGCPGPPLLNKAKNGIEGNIHIFILANLHVCKNEFSYITDKRYRMSILSGCSIARTAYGYP